jgi:single-strand DNA-binding protein
MASFNKVMLIGNLTRDPDVRHTPKGTAVGDLGLAINTTYRTADGTDKEEVCYVDIVVWGRQAETCRDYLSKGSPIFVEGRLQLDQWETPEGGKKSKLRVRAERVQFLGRGKSGSGSGERSGGSARSESSSAPAPEEVHSAPADDDIPF